MELNELTRKVDYEYRRYYNYLLLTSSADIIARAKEIYIKQLIHDRLTADIKGGRLTDKQCRCLISTDDIVDRMYLKSGRNIKIENDSIDDRSWNMMLATVKY